MPKNEVWDFLQNKLQLSRNDNWTIIHNYCKDLAIFCILTAVKYKKNLRFHTKKTFLPHLLTLDTGLPEMCTGPLQLFAPTPGLVL